MLYNNFNLSIKGLKNTSRCLLGFFGLGMTIVKNIYRFFMHIPEGKLFTITIIDQHKNGVPNYPKGLNPPVHKSIHTFCGSDANDR